VDQILPAEVQFVARTEYKGAWLVLREKEEISAHNERLPAALAKGIIQE